MIITDLEIKALCEEGYLVSPFDPSLVNPSSLDYRLGTHFGRLTSTFEDIGSCGIPGYQLAVYRDSPIDPTDKSTFRTDMFEADSLFLEPGEFIIASSLEAIKLPSNISAYAIGKSSLGRLGLHSSTPFAGWIDPGFEAPNLTLELHNVSKFTIKLTAGMKIGQFVFYKHNEVGFPYGSPGVGRYQNQEPGAGSKGI